MNSTKHIDPEDLALFALQFLSADEQVAMRSHLEQCAECRSELAAVQGDLAIYAMTVEQQSPATSVRERLLNQIAREPRTEGRVAAASAVAAETSTPRGSVVSIDDPQDREFRSATRSAGSRFVPWIGWAVAAGLAVSTGQLYRDRQGLREQATAETRRVSGLEAQAATAQRVLETLSDQHAVRVTLTRSKQAPVPQGKATYLADKGSLVFVASNLEPLQPYKVYELWLIPANGHDPVPAGVFHPDSKGDASLVTPDLPKGVVAKAFGITVEDEGGSKSPTMPILLAGAAAGA